MPKKENNMNAMKKKHLNFDDEKDKVSQQSQEKLSKNGNAKTENEEKRPFDKKAYRLKKYSNKYKLQIWEEQRKIKMLKKYQTALANDLAGLYKQKGFDVDATDSCDVPGKYVRHPDLIEQEYQQKKQLNKTKLDPLSKAKEQYKKVKQEKLQKQEAIAKAKEERQKKLDAHKKKRQENFKKLSKKTKKGQPVMSARMEILFDKIKKNAETK